MDVGIVGLNVPLSTGHFGDDLPSSSLDWCKKLVILTNHVAGTITTIIQLQPQKNLSNN